MRICILGAGAMGTACALVASSKNEHEIILWTHKEDHAEEMRSDHENKRFFPGFELPELLRIESDSERALGGVDLAVIAIPTVYLREALTAIAPTVPTGLPVISVAKGLEQKTFLRPSEIILEKLGERSVGAWSGPSHAEELAQGLPASMVIASEDEILAQKCQETFMTDRLRIYTNHDLKGVELAGALKNVVAIAAGIGDGLGFGDNSKSALLTRGLVELIKFGTALGGQQDTFYGLAGIGDLITTCVSPYGRNRAVGEKLGQGMTLDQILAQQNAVAEGVWTCRAVHEEAKQLKIDMPITEAIYSILFEGSSAPEAVNRLMTRDMKSE